MKEFVSQTGGRYTYVDDFINLQNLALSFGSIFEGCENFIISGCEISGSSISPGYVYINKKVRYFNGASDVQFPCYIYEQNTAETLEYANGQEKAGRNIYGCAVGQSVPSGNDPLTDSARQYIILNENGGLRLREAFFGTNCFLLSSDSQTVEGNVTFGGNVNVQGTLSLDSITLSYGETVGRLFHDSNGNFVIQNRAGNGTIYGIGIVQNSGFSFTIGGNSVLNISSESIATSLPFRTQNLKTSNISISSNNIYEHATNSDDAKVMINMLGYNGGVSKYRDTIIGDGKGNAVVTIEGSEASVKLDGSLVLSSSDKDGLRLVSEFECTESDFAKTITFEDSEGYVAAVFGYDEEDSSHIFCLNNNIGDIDILGDSYVNIGPAIKENGTLLSEKYVLRSSLPNWVFGNAPSTGMTQEMCDERYARLTNGLSQFIRGANTAQVLCNQIGALRQTNADSRYAKLNAFLSDMAQTEAQKALIRQNIGAAAALSQNTIYDSGWKLVKGDSLFARQWGKVVTIQGRIPAIYASMSLPLFTLPTGIAPPAYAVETTCGESLGTSMNHDFRFKIEGGQRNAYVTYCSQGMYQANIIISLTYMVQ